ncbi:hypothetical protein ACQY0O_001486 [Thecaphora frezii]
MAESDAQAAVNATALGSEVPLIADAGTTPPQLPQPSHPPTNHQQDSAPASPSSASASLPSALESASGSHGSFSPSTSPASTPVSQTFHLASAKAEAALQRVVDERRSQPGRRVAQWLFDAVHRVQLAVQTEIDSRVSAIGGFDNMWLLIQDISAFNPVCSGTFTFQGPVKPELLRAALLRQAETFPRYKQRLVNAGRLWHGPRFVDDPNFDMDNHLTVRQLPGKAGVEEFDAFISAYIAQPWDYSRPLWEICLLDNFNDPATGACCATVVRGHHTLSDGQGFTMSQLFISSLGPKIQSMTANGAQLLHDARRGKALPSRINRSLAPLDRYHGSVLLQLLMLCLYWMTSLVSLLIDLVGSVRMALTTSFFFLATFWRQRYVTASYPGPRTSEKETSRSAAFTLSDVQRISRAFSGAEPGGYIDRLLPSRKRSAHPTLIGHHLTVNDVVCTIIADVINDELDRKEAAEAAAAAASEHDQGGAGTSTGKEMWRGLKRWTSRLGPNRIAIMVPISIRGPNDWSMKNLMTGALAYLPATRGMPRDAAQMHRRLHGSRRGLSVLKTSLLPKAAFYAIQLTGQLPALFPAPFGLLPVWRYNVVRAITMRMTEWTMCSFTAVVTNVPCPSRERIRLAEQEVVQWTAMPPQAGKGTLAIGICSYAGEVSICVSADHVEGSHGVAQRLTRSFEKRWREYVEVADEVIAASAGGQGKRHAEEKKKQ